MSEAKAHERKFPGDVTDAFAGFSKPIVAAVVGFAVRSQRQRRHVWRGWQREHSWAGGSRLR